MQQLEGLIVPAFINEFTAQVFAFFTTRLLRQSPSELLTSYISEGGEPLMPHQRHTDTVVMVDGVSSGLDVVADAVITNSKGVFIGVKTADCVPILLFDPVSRSVGAVHAGWRGTAKGILQKTIRQMEANFGASPKDLLIAIGPSIRACCYQVGSDVASAIGQAVGDGACIIERDGSYYADLQMANVIGAVGLGIQEGNIWVCRECTCCLPDRYHSYRYNKEQTLRQYGIIGLMGQDIPLGLNPPLNVL